MNIPDLPEMHGDLPKRYGSEANWRGKNAEVNLCRSRLLKWCNGCGLDLGSGNAKIRDEAVGIDDSELKVAQLRRNISDLSCFCSDSFDYIFSSHALEDVQDVKAALTEWLRVIRPGGYLILYCPDKQYYFNVGHPRANQRHRHDFYWWDVARLIAQIKPQCNLVHYARFGPVDFCGEWSWELVVEKR